MKTFVIAVLILFAGLFGGVGVASYGSAPAVASSTLVALGGGLIGLALWGRRTLRR